MMEFNFKKTGFKFSGECMYMYTDNDDTFAKRVKQLLDKMPKNSLFEAYINPSIYVNKEYNDTRLVHMTFNRDIDSIDVYVFDNNEDDGSDTHHRKQMILHMLYKNKSNDTAVSVWIPLKSSNKRMEDEITNYIKMLKKCLVD